MNTKVIEVIIADDEPNSRSYLNGILKQHSDIKIISEVDNGQDLVDLTSLRKAQLAFVDVEMPGMDGVSAVKKIKEVNEDLLIIFITCHPDFAVNAFELYSLDYIVKPYTPERVAESLERVRNRLKERDLDVKKLSKLIKSNNKLHIKCGHELHFIDTDSIYFIEKDKKKTIIHTTKNRYETHETINEIEGRLNPMDFFRSHKSYLINLKMVEKIIPWASDSYLAKFLDCNRDAIISRSKIKLFYKLLDEF